MNKSPQKKQKNSASKKPKANAGGFNFVLSKKAFWISICLIFLVTIGMFFTTSTFLSPNSSITYVSPNMTESSVNKSSKKLDEEEEGKNEGENKNKEEKRKEVVPTTHIDTPSDLKAVYISSWTAGTPAHKQRIFKLIEETELNSIVIDIKDFSGRVAFSVPGSRAEKFGAPQERTPEIKKVINKLHEEDIYVIGRIVVFQDPYLAEEKKGIAVKRRDNGDLWSDKKGLHYIDPGSQFAWDYNLELAEYAYKEKGFDEINFDYIRFPSDGNVNNAYYPISSPKMDKATTTYGKADALEEFFAYLKSRLEKTKGMKTSADIFGMTTTKKDGMNIGQVLERTVPHFDYVCPMVYPSHYPSGFKGWSNPNEHQYELVKYSMTTAIERLEKASTSPEKLRPWLQDFDYGGNYGPKEVRQQIQATYDAGLSSWMLWSPKNVYTREALKEKE